MPRKVVRPAWAQSIGLKSRNKENLESMRNMAYNERQERLSINWIIDPAAKSGANDFVAGLILMIMFGGGMT